MYGILDKAELPLRMVPQRKRDKLILIYLKLQRREIHRLLGERDSEGNVIALYPCY